MLCAGCVYTWMYAVVYRSIDSMAVNCEAVNVKCFFFFSKWCCPFLTPDAIILLSKHRRCHCCFCLSFFDHWVVERRRWKRNHRTTRRTWKHRWWKMRMVPQKRFSGMLCLRLVGSFLNCWRLLFRLDWRCVHQCRHDPVPLLFFPSLPIFATWYFWWALFLVCTRHRSSIPFQRTPSPILARLRTRRGPSLPTWGIQIAQGDVIYQFEPSLDLFGFRFGSYFA